MKRETGYYWAKRIPIASKFDGGQTEWEIAYYEVLPNRCVWTITPFEDEFTDSAFCEINETRILNPDEKNGDRKMVEKFDLERLIKYDEIFADKKPATHTELNDVDIVKILMEKFNFNHLIKDDKVMDGSFDITVRELLEIIKHFR